MTDAELQAEGLETSIAPSATLKNPPFLTVTGSGNRLILGENAILGSFGRPKLEFLGNGNSLIIEENCEIKRGHYRFFGDNMTIRFGRETTVEKAYFLCTEGASIRVGVDCMLSYDIEFRTSDAHSILDAATGARVNPAQDITLGDHVWVGKGAVMMPGATIPSDTIIGTRALVTGEFTEPNTVIGGIPGKVISHGRSWDRRLL